MRWQVSLLALFGMVSALGLAQDVVRVSSCSNQAPLPIPFEVDCSHVSDPANKQLCKPFAENQACKVFQAYRKITGINLEDSCHAYKYTIYDKDKWPHPVRDGGLDVGCGSDYIADYSIFMKSEIGPYDVHEILHVYQDQLGALPYEHVLFGSAMAEARREIGDNRGYGEAMTRLKSETARAEIALQKDTFGHEDQCRAAESYVEASLYIKDTKNVDLYYRKLVRSWAKDMADRQRRFNRMFDVVSDGTAKQILLQHCPRF